MTTCLLALCSVLNVWNLALQELDVVDEEHVDVAVTALEVRGLVVADAVDEVVGELL